MTTTTTISANSANSAISAITATSLQTQWLATAGQPKEVAELRRQVALENLQNQRLDNYDQDVPVEFECCFCTTKVPLLEKHLSFSSIAFDFARIRQNRKSIIW